MAWPTEKLLQHVANVKGDGEQQIGTKGFDFDIKIEHDPNQWPQTGGSFDFSAIL